MLSVTFYSSSGRKNIFYEVYKFSSMNEGFLFLLSDVRLWQCFAALLALYLLSFDEITELACVSGLLRQTLKQTKNKQQQNNKMSFGEYRYLFNHKVVAFGEN